MSFPAASIYPQVGISLSASETNDRFYLSFLVTYELARQVNVFANIHKST